MKELVKSIIDHKDYNDPKIVFFLIECIKKHNINSLDDLKKYEDSHYIIIDPEGDIVLTEQEIIDRLYKDYDDDYDDYMALDVDKQSKLDELNEEFLKTDDIDKKFINLIKMYSLMDWDLALPYRAYNYIIEDKL
jgi:hypothetical protein